MNRSEGKVIIDDELIKSFIEYNRSYTLPYSIDGVNKTTFSLFKRGEGVIQKLLEELQKVLNDEDRFIDLTILVEKIVKLHIKELYENSLGNVSKSDHGIRIKSNLEALKKKTLPQ
ncbi:MAG: hypothetical protein AB9836_05230 [Aminipila sp.]